MTDFEGDDYFEEPEEDDEVKYVPGAHRLTLNLNYDEGREEVMKQSLLQIEESLASMTELISMLSSSQKSERKYANKILKKSVLPKFHKAYNEFEEDIDEIFRVETNDGWSFFTEEYMDLLEKGKYNEARKLAFSVLSQIMDELKRYFF